LSLLPELFVARRYLFGGKNTGSRYLLGAAAGIALSLVPIVVTLIIADGMIQGITNRYLELSTGHIEVWDNYLGRFRSDGLADAKKITAGVQGVRGVWAERQGLGVILGNKGKTSAVVRAMDSSFWKDPGAKRFLEVKAGSTDLSDSDALLGESLAKEAGVQVGDKIRLMSVRQNTDGNIIPRVAAFTVKGIVSSGYHELDALWCVITTKAGDKLLSPDYSSNCLVVKIDNPYTDLEATRARISTALNKEYGVYTWKELQRSQYQSYESTRQMLLFIMALIVLVAAVNVSSATSMLALERQRDIAIMKTFGTGVRRVRRIFVAGGFLTGLTGTIVGLAVGLLAGRFINEIITGLEAVSSAIAAVFHSEPIRILNSGYYLERVPIVIDWKEVAAIGIFTVLASILASYFPARKACKIKPVEILRKY
jgi:lipoprotein-releasing system permease protein